MKALLALTVSLASADICTVDDYSLYSTITHKEVRVKPTSPYDLTYKEGKDIYIVAHKGRVRHYHRVHSANPDYAIYQSGSYLIIYDQQTGRHYLKRVGTAYTIPMICD